MTGTVPTGSLVRSQATDEESESAATAEVPGVAAPPLNETSLLLPPPIVSEDDAAEVPLYLNGLSRGRFWAVFSAVLAAHFMACFDATIMASSHPVITSFFGAAQSASWLSTAFMLASTATQPLLGRLSDSVGRKPLFLASLILLAAATGWCAVAGSIESFIAARAACGLGAGGAMALGSIIIGDLVPIERRGNYQSYLNVTYGLGSALGAALGGAMAETLGWRWEFGVQVPPLMLCVAVAAVAVPPGLGVPGGADEDRGAWQALRSFDAAGSVLLTAATSFLILGLSLGGNTLAWSHPLVVASLASFAICVPGFLIVELRAAEPIIPLRLVRRPPRANLIFANFFGAIISSSVLFNVPIYFQAVLLSSATVSGLSLVLPSIIASMAGTGCGFAITWSRRLKWPLGTGVFFYLTGSFCLCLLRRGLPSAVYLAALVPSGLGQGFQFLGTFMAVLACSPQSEQAVVTSTLILWRSLGNILGVACSSLVLQNALVHYLDRYIQGPRRRLVVARVRASVDAVSHLDQPYQLQAVRSYEAALRLTFASCVAMAVLSALLTWPIKLPRLATRKRQV